jgi:hypothetical protein
MSPCDNERAFYSISFGDLVSIPLFLRANYPQFDVEFSITLDQFGDIFEVELAAHSRTLELFENW